jgi:hypothetical protein
LCGIIDLVSGDCPRQALRIHALAREAWAIGQSVLPSTEEPTMNAPSMKDKIVQTVQSLPADATVEDAMERLLFLAKIERGLQQADNGKTIPHDEIRRRFVK